MKRVSLADVANDLKVSKTLVSLVLNQKGDQHGISKQTQARVLAKAEELNYFPNQMARGLRMGKSGTIGLIVADIANPFYATIARKIEDETNKAGYNLIICSSDEKDEKELRLLKMLRDRQVDGLIVSSTLQRPNALADLKRLGYPIVLIDRAIPRLDVPAVLVDNYQGAFNLTKHLIDLGHKRIGHLSLSPVHISTLRDRLKGYKDALKAAGIKHQSSWILNIPFDDVRGTVEKELPAMIGGKKGVTALFTANNNIAVSALEVIRNMGLNIPHDMAFCSFDDIDLFRLMDPPITACAQPREEIAIESVKLLKDLIKKVGNGEAASADNLVLSTTLRLRPSTLNGNQ
ncbi:MAG TPA: LacI family DNA-binding transcriptional regulator [Bacteroidales bacterium]|nr:LacI family DNA-binding transcriptional regulator [Bacteroidales bacterium]